MSIEFLVVQYKKNDKKKPQEKGQRIKGCLGVRQRYPRGREAAADRSGFEILLNGEPKQ